MTSETTASRAPRPPRTAHLARRMDDDDEAIYDYARNERLNEMDKTDVASVYDNVKMGVMLTSAGGVPESVNGEVIPVEELDGLQDQRTQRAPLRSPMPIPKNLMAPADLIDHLDKIAVPAMAGPVQIVVAAQAGAEVAAYRRVNEQARGELAGQKTGVNSDARYIATELVAQKEAFSAKRVLGEAIAGDLAGKKTHVTIDSRHVKSELAAQSDVNVYRRVNEQARGELAGKKTAIDAQSQQISTARKSQLYQSEVLKVNEQFRGELVGKSAYDHRAALMVTTQKAAKMASEIHRVNEQARGEFAGQKTGFDNQSVELLAYRAAQERASKEKREKAGMFGDVSRDKIADAR